MIIYIFHMYIPYTWYMQVASNSYLHQKYDWRIYDMVGSKHMQLMLLTSANGWVRSWSACLDQGLSFPNTANLNITRSPDWFMTGFSQKQALVLEPSTISSLWVGWSTGPAAGPVLELCRHLIQRWTLKCICSEVAGDLVFGWKKIVLH